MVPSFSAMSGGADYSIFTRAGPAPAPRRDARSAARSAGRNAPINSASGRDLGYVGTMAARSVGSGTISFGLVSIPIKLYTATSPQSVGFNFVHQKCGGRVKMQYLCPVDNEVVERKDLIRGYEIAKDKYVTFTEDELKKLEGERSDRLDIVEFVPADSVDFIYIESTHYLGPGKGGDRAYALLSDAMERTGRVAIGRYGQRGKDQLVMLRPYKGGLVMHQVYYADEVRSMDDVEYSTNVPFKQVEQELAEKLIAQLSTEKFSPEKYHDEYR